MAYNEFPGDFDSPDAGIRVSRRIADELRRTRVAHGLSIEDVAAILRIRTGFIEAMEEDRFDDLPGPVYISGFLRTYANHLGLDGEQLVAWFKDDSHSTFARQEMELPVPITEIRRPTFPIITVSLVVAVGIAVAWYVYQESRSIDIDLIPEVPGPVAEGTSGALNGDDVFGTGHPEAATDTMQAAVEPADVPTDTAGEEANALADTAEDITADVADVTVDAGADDAAAEEEAVVLPAATDGAGGTVDAGADDAAAGEEADVLADTAGDVIADVAVDAGADDAAAEEEAVVLSAAADGAGEAVDAGPDDAAAGEEADVSPDTGDAADVAVSGVEIDTSQDDAGTATDVALQDVADATGADSGGVESWDEPVFASEDAVQVAAAGDGETDSQHTVYGTPGAGSRIELRAIDETWVQVTAPDGVAVLTHILLPGDVYHVPDRDDLMLDTGNAGGLEVRVDGELVSPLGGAGAVVRDILLSVEWLTRR